MGFFASLIISFAFMVIGELLRPKPETEKLKPSGLSDFKFPTSDPSRTIGVFWGTCKFEGPNVPWFGDLSSVTKRKKIKTGWFSSTKVDLGINYYLGIMMSIAWGGESVVLVDITVGEDQKCLLDGADATDMGDYYEINFDAPDILGGTEDLPNGIKGPAKFYKGTRTQTANLYLQSKFPEVETCGFRGLMYFVLEHCYIGNSDTPPPFIVTARRCPNPLGLTGGKHNINGDANFANMCYEVLTENAYWGLSTDPAKIDIASFIECAEILYDESLGGSMQQETSVTGKALLAEMLRHVDGVIYSDPATGLWTMRLARGGYDVETLPVFDNKNIVPGSFEFSRVSYAETRNVISINYTDREANFQTLPVEYRDKANQFARGGIVDFESIDFLGLSNSAAAGLVASRVGKTRSSPLGRCEFRVHRDGSTLRPASVIVLNKSDFNIVGLVMRVVKIDYGSMDDPQITIICTEDIYAINTMAFLPAPSEGSGWEPVVGGALVALAHSKIMEAPYEMVDSENRHLIALGSRADDMTEGFQVWSASGAADVYLHTGTANGVLASGALVADFELGDVTFDVDDVIDSELLVSPTIDEYTAAQSLLVIDDEIIAWMTVTDNLDGTYTVSDFEPAIYDTVRSKHLAGARVYFLNSSVPLVNAIPYSEDQWIFTRLPTFAQNTVMAVLDVPYQLTQTRYRAQRPNPPGKVRINGLRDYELGAGVTGSFSLSWAHRNKTSSVNGFVSQDADDISPALGTRYEVYIYNDSTDALLMEIVNLAESPVTISVGTTATLRIELFTVDVDGQRSLFPQVMTFAHTSTGANSSVGNDGGPAPTTETAFNNAKAVSISNITLSAPQTVNTVALVAGDRVLVNGQTVASQNGIYQVRAGAWTRAFDADANADFYAGKQVYVTGGTVANIGYWNLTTAPVTLGVTSISFSKVGGAAGGTFVAAGGTADAITATYTDAPVLTDGLELRVRATGPNTITNPTFNPNGLGALTIYKWGGNALGVADIYGAGHELTFRYRAAPARYELLNPASGVGGGVAAGDSLAESITQVAHGFVVGNVLARNSGAYVLATRGDPTKSAIGIVSSVTNANTFVLTSFGKVAGLSGLVDGDFYWLDTTAGAMTAVPPTTGLSQEVGQARGTTELFFYAGNVLDLSAASEAETFAVKWASVLYVGQSTPLAVAGTTLTSPVLNLSADEEYEIEVIAKNGTAGDFYASMYYNADFTATNYDSQFDSSNGVTLTGARQNDARAFLVPASSTINAKLAIRNDVDGKPSATIITREGSTGGIRFSISGHHHRNAVNVALISFIGTANFAIGSYFKIWKRISGTPESTEGPAWPVTPRLWQRFFNTTLMHMGFWNGTYWLSVHESEISFHAAETLAPITLTNTVYGRGALRSDFGYYITRWAVSPYQAAAGTAIAYWTGTLYYNLPPNTPTAFGSSFNTIAFALGWNNADQVMNFALPLSLGAKSLQTGFVKTGSAPTLYPITAAHYRLILG